MVLPKQIDKLLDFLENHRELALGHINISYEARNIRVRLWQDCANILNSVSRDGAQKSWSMWRTFYADYKSRLIRRVKLSKQQLLGTGGGPNRKVNLSSQQERLLRLLGEDVGDPVPCVCYIHRHSTSTCTMVDTNQNQATPLEATKTATPTERIPVQDPRISQPRTSRRRRARRLDTSGSPSAPAGARELFSDVGSLGAEATLELSRSNHRLAEAVTSSAELLAGAMDRIAAAITHAATAMMQRPQ